MMAGRRIVVFLSVAAVAALLVTARWAFAGPGHAELLWPGTGSGGLGMVVATGVPVVDSNARVCLNKPGSVTVVDATLIEPTGGLQLKEWAVAPGFYDNDDTGKHLADLGLSLLSRTVTVDCATAEAHANDANPPHAVLPPTIALELVRPWGTRATMRGVRLTYLTDGRRHTMVLPYSMALCAESCDAPSPVRSDRFRVATDDS